MWRFSTVIYLGMVLGKQLWVAGLEEGVEPGGLWRSLQTFLYSVKSCGTEQSLTMLVSSISKDPVTAKPDNSRQTFLSKTKNVVTCKKG